MMILCPLVISHLSSPLSSRSGDSVSHNPILDDILKWDTYDDFMSFCSKIGIMISDRSEAKRLLDFMRSRHSLPVSNLDFDNDCVELLWALHC